MSTGYSWEGIRQVRATLLGAPHVPLWWLYLLGALYQVFDLYFYLTICVLKMPLNTKHPSIRIIHILCRLGNSGLRFYFCSFFVTTLY